MTFLWAHRKLASQAHSESINVTMRDGHHWMEHPDPSNLVTSITGQVSMRPLGGGEAKHVVRPEIVIAHHICTGAGDDAKQSAPNRRQRRARRLQVRLQKTLVGIGHASGE
ncbi:hypothetical protein FGB62_25g43 [Gracilaria domingensis]|nr:hypothetical protein FGB62_25g43 [Gracilaria domingensis]